MENECPNPKCEVMESGVCALHNVEVERRKNMSELVNNIPQMLTKLNKLIGIMTYFGIALSASFVFAAGAFIYTWTTSKQIEEISFSIKDKTDQKIDRLTDEVNRVVRVASLNEFKYSTVVQELEKLNKNVKEMIITYHGEEIKNGRKEN